jgi:hypothetical protein
MEEIEVGEYVRLNDGIILKYGEKSSTIIENNIYTDYSGEYEWSSEVVKHSPNIIDLIEEGDYVNGEQVTDIWDSRVSSVKSNFNEEDIKSICTKERFENISYKVEG